MSEKFSGVQFAKMLGVSPDNLYDWKRRGIDLGNGTAVNGRKRFDKYDLLEAVVWLRVRRIIFDDMSQAFRVARDVLAPAVARYISATIDRDEPGLDSGGRWVFWSPWGHSVQSDDPSDHGRAGLAEGAATGVVVFDLAVEAPAAKQMVGECLARMSED
jgi:hypothetical protein